MKPAGGVHTKRQISDTEHKLVLLYTLRSLGPVTDSQLLTFLSALDLMNYFEMQVNLLQLQDEGEVTAKPHHLGTLLSLSDAGRYDMEAFLHRLPPSRRTQIEESAKEWKIRFKAEQEALAESFDLADGRQCLRLRLLEKENPVLELLLTLPAGKRMNRLHLRWQRCAQAVYGHLVETLFAAAPGTPPDDAVIQPVEGSWMLMLDSPALSLMLFLPEEEIARRFAAAWPGQAAELEDYCQQQLEAVFPE